MRRDLEDKIVALVASGLSLSKVSERAGMPSRATLYAWLESRPDFAERLARARERVEAATPPLAKPQPSLRPCNDRGFPIGEGHHNCTIPDAVVARWRDLHEQGITPTEIARREGAALSTVKKVVYYFRRGQVPDPDHWRPVKGEDDARKQ